MALETCLPASDISTTTATLNGQADLIPVNEFIRFAYGTVSGGPYLNTTPNVPGDNSAPQVISAPISGLENGTTYYYVVQHLAADGTTVINSSSECSLTTDASFNPECAVVAFDGQAGTVTISATADFVPPEANLDLIWGNVPGGPYPNVCATVPGDNTENQTIQCTLTDADFPPCATIFFAARVSNIPAEYIVDWEYAHMNRITGQNETVTLTLGDEADYPANQVVVDVDVQNVNGTWHLKSGTFPVPAGVDNLHMGFTGTGGQPNLGNYLDSCSIILRTAGGEVLGEQLVNGSFEVPVVAPGIRSGCQVLPNGGFGLVHEANPIVAWQTTAPDSLIEIWDGPSDFDCAYGQGNLPLVAHTGDQWAELSANFQSELFQVVPLDKKSEQSTECQVAVTQVECLPATDVTDTTATLNGLACGIWRGTQTRFEYGPCAGPRPFQFATPWVFHDGETDQQLISAVIELDCDTDICYRVVASFDNFDDPISISDECSLTTEPCGVPWCGGIHDPNQCVFVPTNDGGYFNCNIV